MRNIISCFLVSALLLVGCQTTANSAARHDRVARIAGLAAHLGTRAVLVSNPQYRPAFVATLIALDQLVAAGNTDPAALGSAMQTNLPVSITELGDKEKKGQGSLYISVALVVWDEVSGFATGINQNDLVKKTTVAVRDGLARGLQ